MTRPFASFAVIAALSSLGCSAQTSYGGASDDASVAADTTAPGPRACEPGPNVCACADIGPADFSRAKSGAASETSDDAQRAALVRTNHWRTAAGLAPINASARLEQAATAHSTFMASNASSCWPGAHFENDTSGCDGYTGRSPGDRVGATGYRMVAGGEVINWNATPVTSIDGWIWTVYHRTPFQDPGLTEAGFASVAGPYNGRPGHHNTMDFARPAGVTAGVLRDVSVFPPPGTTDVPVAFQGNTEGPTPPVPVGGSWPSGPVISMMFPSTTFTIEMHHLYDGRCAEVEHSLFRAPSVSTVSESQPDANLSNPRFVFLYATRPLARATHYTVEVRGSVDGAPWSRVWGFDT